MALSPLVVSAQDPSGNLLGGAYVDVRNRLTLADVIVYDASGVAMAAPYVTNSAGLFTGWLVNGIYEWRVAAGVTVSEWTPFRAYAGAGAEGGPYSSVSDVSLDDPMPPNGSGNGDTSDAAVLSTVVVPSLGVEDQIGDVRVAVDFAFDHIYDLIFALELPDGSRRSMFSGPTMLAGTAGDAAFDGSVTFSTSGDDAGEGLVDGGLFDVFNVNTLTGQPASGTWSLLWKQGVDLNTGLPVSATHTGLVRSWSVELVPA